MNMIDHLRQYLYRDGAITLKLRIRSGAPETKIVGVLEDGTVKVAVRAAAEKQRANEELVGFLADEFNVPRGNITLLAGAAERRKRIRITAAV